MRLLAAAPATLQRTSNDRGSSGLDVGSKTSLPGEITSPNRRLRAALCSPYPLPSATGQEGVGRVLNVLDNFNIPQGHPSIRTRSVAEQSNVHGEHALRRRILRRRPWTQRRPTAGREPVVAFCESYRWIGALPGAGASDWFRRRSLSP